MNSVPGLSPAPIIVDHKKEINPYLSLYGENWEDEIKKRKILNKVLVISDLVCHIVDESSQIMQNTEFLDNWFFIMMLFC